MDIIETFLRLTSRTYPHGTEADLFGLLPEGLGTDDHGNKYIKIGDSSCMFTSHLDTATAQRSEVVHIIDGDICKTDGKSILGADDKAGVTIMLWMIHNSVPGLYYFFLGEEVGCVGSKALAAKIKDAGDALAYPFLEGINKVISFDRRGTDSVITYQASSRCCSDTFAQALADELNRFGEFKYSKDSGGIWTDSAQFTRIYPECTNISVGYRSEHTWSESQDLGHLVRLGDTCLSVNWETLPVERDPASVDYSSRWDDYDYGYGGYSYPASRSGWSSRDSGYYGGYYPATENKGTQPTYFFDELHNHVSSVTYRKYSKEAVDIELCDERLEYEMDKISDVLESLEVDYTEFTWDGMNLKVKKGDDLLRSCTRSELADFVPELDFWKDIVEADLRAEELCRRPSDAWDDRWSSDLSLVY